MRYVEWTKYIKTYTVPNGHASHTSGNVESEEEDAVGVHCDETRSPMSVPLVGVLALGET